MLEDQLERQESYRRFVYDDATGQEIVPGYTVQGNPTIGYGRDLMTEGISKEEAMVLLRHDIDRAWREVTSHLPWAESQLSVIRFAVLVNMAFNVGLQGLLGFTQMLSALQAGNYEQAAKAMLDSLWYQQTEGRAQALAEQKIGYLDDAKKNTTFRYDGLNRRAVMVEMNGSDNQTTTFLWDGTDLLVAKTGNLLKRYYPQGELHGNEKLFYVSDRLGSVRETVNQDCLITARMRYSAYGMTRTELPIFIGKTPDYRYAGLFFHEQSGLYLAVFRAYDPQAGRWINKNPVDLLEGNLFKYVSDSPVNYIDKLGLFVDVGSLIGLGAAIGGATETGIEAAHCGGHGINALNVAEAIGFGALAVFIGPETIAGAVLVGAGIGAAEYITSRLISGKPITLFGVAENAFFGGLGGENCWADSQA